MALRRLSDALIRLPRAGKRLLAVGLDAVLCALTVWMAWSLRLEQWVRPTSIHAWTTLGAWLLSLPVFWFHGLYASIFRYSGLNAMLALGRAMSVYGALFAGVVSWISIPGIPRSIGIIQPLLLFVALALSRIVVRFWLGDLYHELLRKLHAPGVLIYGAGAAGQQLAAGLLKMSDQRLVGFIDDNAALQGRSLDGIRIHTPAELAGGLPPAGSAGGLGASGHGRAGCRPRQPARNGVLERAASPQDVKPAAPPPAWSGAQLAAPDVKPMRY